MVLHFSTFETRFSINARGILNAVDAKVTYKAFMFRIDYIL